MWNSKTEKKQKKYYSGKKKKHTLKVQVIANAENRNIICISVASGHKHDFKIFKESGVHFAKQTQVIVDKGYQGIAKLHVNSVLPRKASKKHKLTLCEKLYNRLVARCRVYIENINSYLKRFRIFSGKYRNHRKRFSLRFVLICAVYNFQHT